MQPSEITVFAVTMFLALTALIMWKRRRDLNAARVNRGLRGYMAAEDAVQLRAEGAHGEDLIPA